MKVSNTPTNGKDAPVPHHEASARGALGQHWDNRLILQQGSPPAGWESRFACRLLIPTALCRLVFFKLFFFMRRGWLNCCLAEGSTVLFVNWKLK